MTAGNGFDYSVSTRIIESSPFPLSSAPISCRRASQPTLSVYSTSPTTPLLSCFAEMQEGSEDETALSFPHDSTLSPVDYLMKFADILKVIGSLSNGYLLLFNEEGLYSINAKPGIIQQFYNTCTCQETIDLSTYKADGILGMLQQTMEEAEKQLSSLKEENKEKEVQLERVLLALRDLVVKAQGGIQHFKTTCEHLQVSVTSSLYDSILETIENKILSALPTDRIAVDIGKEKGWLEVVTDLIWQSDRPEDIDWKIQRYHTIMVQLKKHFEEIKSEVFGDDETDLGIEALFFDHEKIYDTLVALNTLFETLTLDSNEITLTRLNTLRKGHQEFLQLLRALDKAVPVDDDGIELQKANRFVNALSEAVMTKIQLVNESKVLIAKFSQWGRQTLAFDPKIMEMELSHMLTLTHQQISNVPGSAFAPALARACNSTRKHWGSFWGYDPISQSNIPQLIGTLNINVPQRTRSIKLIAFGTPTIEGEQGIFDYGCVAPECLRFMLSYKNSGKSHLYIMLQDMRHAMQNIPFGSSLERLRGGVEHNRINVVLEAASQEKYKGSLYCVVRSKNSPFYYQSGEFEHQDHAATFIETLIHQDFDLDPTVSGNYFSPEVMEKIPNLKEIATQTCTLIHSTCFPLKEYLTKEEREIFIDLYEDELVRILSIQLDVDSLSFGCKDTADRSGAAVARFIANLSLRQQITDIPAFMECIETLALSRGVMVCKRGPFQHRIHRTIQDIEFMCKYAVNLIELQANSPCPYGIIPALEGLTFDTGSLT